MKMKNYLNRYAVIFFIGLISSGSQVFAESKVDPYPNTISAQEAARLSLKDLESKYLEDRCGNSCLDLLRTEFNPKDPLSLAEQIVISRYTEVNVVENQRIMTAALMKLPNQSKLVFRGGSSKKFKVLRVGQVMQFDRMTSTSVNRTKAEEFITDQLLKIKTKTVKDIQHYSVVSEGEHLYLPGVKFRVDKISTIKVDLSYEEETRIQDVQFVELTEI